MNLRLPWVSRRRFDGLGASMNVAWLHYEKELNSRRDAWAKIRELEAANAELTDALDLAAKGCGSAIQVTNNERNFSSSFPGGMDFFRAMGDDARLGYQAAHAILDSAERSEPDE